MNKIRQGLKSPGIPYIKNGVAEMAAPFFI
jgi:hypothetical protein